MGVAESGERGARDADAPRPLRLFAQIQCDRPARAKWHPMRHVALRPVGWPGTANAFHTIEMWPFPWASWAAVIAIGAVLVAMLFTPDLATQL